MLLRGGPPPAPPAAPRGAGLSARRLCKIRTHQNVEVCGRSEDETPRKCILQAENIMPGSKKLWEEHLFPSEKIVFSPFGRKNNHFFLRKQKFASEFFCPWHNVSTQKEHIFFTCEENFPHTSIKEQYRKRLPYQHTDLINAIQEKLRKTFCCYNCLDLYHAQSFFQVFVTCFPSSLKQE